MLSCDFHDLLVFIVTSHYTSIREEKNHWFQLLNNTVRGKKDIFKIVKAIVIHKCINNNNTKNITVYMSMYVLYHALCSCVISSLLFTVVSLPP